MTKHTPAPAGPPRADREPESMAELRSDCARMAPRWRKAAPSEGGDWPPCGPAGKAASPELLHGITVPPRSARLLDGMSEYGD